MDDYQLQGQHQVEIELNLGAWLHALRSFSNMHPLTIRLISVGEHQLVLLMRGSSEQGQGLEHQLRVERAADLPSSAWEPSIPLPHLTLQLTDLAQLTARLQKLGGERLCLTGTPERLSWRVPMEGLEACWEYTNLPLIQSQAQSQVRTGEGGPNEQSQAVSQTEVVWLRRLDVIRALGMWGVEGGAAPLLLSLIGERAAIWTVTLGACLQLLDEEAATGTLCMVLPSLPL